MASGQPIQVEVPASDEGQRADKYVVRCLQGAVGRTRARQLFEEGAVRIDGRRARKGQILHAGCVVSINLEADRPDALPDPDLPLDLCLESAELVIVNKPAGQPTVPLRAGEVGTLANALVARYPEMASIGHGPREPGLVHRLDTNTSGLLLAARTQAAFDELCAALRAGMLHKAYLLVCRDAGLADDGSIELPICPHPKDSRRVLACVHPRDVERLRPRPASTSYHVVRRAHGWALVEATAPRALRHQIRVHFAAIEHPLAGDGLYGGDAEAMTRHALHASELAWHGSQTLPAFHIKLPAPPDFLALLGDE